MRRTIAAWSSLITMVRVTVRSPWSSAVITGREGHGRDTSAFGHRCENHGTYTRRRRTYGGEGATQAVPAAQDARGGPAARQLMHHRCQIAVRPMGLAHPHKLLQEACSHQHHVRVWVPLMNIAWAWTSIAACACASAGHAHTDTSGPLPQDPCYGCWKLSAGDRSSGSNMSERTREL